ncbi:hypothetical protein L603_001400000160 [Cellulosimicrobium cellulans J34]|nr:hypothetical protein L603_001400000160 [Cellulosimicrobium cellulans J34]SME89351.1 hypothetical protein SAMN02744115_00107 [Cellulosimicrobium cellulans J1]
MYRAEMLKLRTTRAAWVVAAVAVAGMLVVQAFTLLLPTILRGTEALGGGTTVGLQASPELAAELTPDLGALTDVTQPAYQRATLDLLGNGLSGSGSVGVATVCMLLLGVLAVTTDFRTGGIVPTALVQPSRLRVLAAKAGATATVALGVGVVLALLGALGLLVAIVTSPGATLALGPGDVLGIWARGLVVLVLLAWLGLGIGTLVRGQVAAVVTVAALALAEPVVRGAVTLLSGGESAAAEWLPLGLGALASTGQSGAAVLGGAAPLGTLAALAGLTAWVVVVLGSGSVTFRRRDLV